MDIKTLMAARLYVRDTANALGAVKGSPCTITSITEADDGIHIVFSWTGTDGTVATQTAIMPYVAVDKVAREAVETLREDMDDAIDTTVRSINGRKPDSAGNVALPLAVTGVPNTGSPHQVFVTDGEGVPRWEDRRLWLELAAICPEVLTDPDVKILYDAGKTEVGANEFANNTDIEVVYFPNVKKIGDAAFWRCTNLKAAIFPKAQDCSAKNIFNHCENLREIYFPELTGTVGMYFASKCSALERVSLPKVTEIKMGSEFQFDSALRNVELPELVRLDSTSFQDCTALTKLDLPKLTYLNRRFIDKDTGLKALILRSETMCTLDSAFLASTPIGAGTCFIYVPSALIDTYKADSVWSNHAAQFRAIEDWPEICGKEYITKGEAAELIDTKLEGAGGGVGISMAGMSVKPYKNTTVTAGKGAEVFNDTREREYYVTGYPSAGNVASGDYSHAEGKMTTAYGDFSHAEGSECVAHANYSHAEGLGCNSSGSSAHAEGYNTIAKGMRSHAEGYCTNASGKFQHVQGQFNVVDNDSVYAHIVGNGTSPSVLSNAHTLDWSGNAWFAGTVEGTGLILKSSTADSTKRFLITVDDSGTITATEVTE